jgi:pre-mRNA-splicing factor 18
MAMKTRLSSLKALVEKKKQTAPTVAANNNGNNKYKTRAEIEEEQRQAKKKLEEAQNKGKGKEPEETVVESTKKEEEEDIFLDLSHIKTTISRDEVIKRLKKLREPITFFGETDVQRERRLLQLEASAPADSEYKFGYNDQFGRDLKLMEKAEMDHSVGTSSNGVGPKLAGASSSTTVSIEDELEEEEDLALKALENLEGVVDLTREEEILLLFRRLLKDWENELNERPDAVKRTAQGKVATATYKQTLRNIRPLFKLLQKKTLALDILRPLEEICRWLKAREYVKANDAYLRMAIGNAPWPMGVTMVGIHERSAREKIFSNQVAHILNDETQRKYIQAVKRLMSFAQSKYPTDPSKSIG